jgi:hypothetical protein
MRRTSAHRRQPRRTEPEIYGRLPLEPNAGQLQAEALLATWATVSPAGSGIYSGDVVVVCQQQVTRLYEIGSRKTYYVAGAAQAYLQAARVIAPVPLCVQFFRAFTPPRPDSASLDCRPVGVEQRVGQSRAATWLFNGFEVAAVGSQVVSGGIAVQAQVRGYFAGLEVNNTY